MEIQDSVVIVFTKAPTQGQVKTRLIPQYGVEFATRLHVNLVEYCLETIANDGFFSLQLWCSPDTDHEFFRDCENRFPISLHAQMGVDLGERMKNAFICALDSYTNVVVIGTDCPTLSVGVIHEALHSLKKYDAVLTPASDGGYALIGLKENYNEIFDNILWGTDTVLSTTRKRFESLGLNWFETETLWDVDRPADIDKLRTFSSLSGLLPQYY